MSEYQYYEFLAVDRPLDKAQQAELRALSTRAEITSTRFQNTYDFGDFRGDPDKLMERYFDAFVYVANWGTHWLMFRLPRRLLDIAVASRYEMEGQLEVRSAGDSVALSFRSEEEEGDWDGTSEGWMPSLVPLRADLASGDLRCLYLGWLAGTSESYLMDEVEPPVPPGLGCLSAPLRSLADFLRLDEDLIAEAASRSAPTAAEPARADLERWLRELPAAEKDDVLIRLVGGAANLQSELVQRFRQSRLPPVSSASSQTAVGRTIGELLAAAKVRGERRRREAAAREARERAVREREAALARARYLDGLVGREADLWQRVERRVGTKRPTEYDEAIQRLLDLRDLAKRAGEIDRFTVQLAELRVRHATKSALIRRIDRAGLR